MEDPVENIGARLVRQAASKTNDLAGDGTTTSVVLAQGLITEGVKVCKGFVTCFSLGTQISVNAWADACNTYMALIRSGGSSWCQPCSNH